MVAVGTGATIDRDTLRHRLSELVMVPAADVRLEWLNGGFSRETWLAWVSARAGGGSWVLSVERAADPLSTALFAQPAEAQHRLLVHLRDRRLPVPFPVAGTDAMRDGIGSILVTAYVDGAVSPRDVLRLARSGRESEQLGRALAGTLARIHTVSAVPGVELHAYRDGSPWIAAAVQAFTDVDPAQAGEAAACVPALLCAAGKVPAPPAEVLRLVHGDYRTGNIICGPAGVRAVLDWELAHFGDPVEDVAWFRLDPWRFRANLAGGIITDEGWLRAYEEASGRRCEPERLRYWDIVGCAKMSLLALETLRRTPPPERGWLQRMIRQLSDRLKLLL